MTINFVIVTAHIHRLSNLDFTEEVVVGCLTTELSTNIVRRVSGNKVYLCLDVIASLLEMMQEFFKWELKTAAVVLYSSTL